jgi:hypothetical protein
MSPAIYLSLLHRAVGLTPIPRATCDSTIGRDNRESRCAQRNVVVQAVNRECDHGEVMAGLKTSTVYQSH